MYLDKRTFVGNQYRKKSEQVNITVPKKRRELEKKAGALALPEIKKERISYISENVCYWRKANQIHKWFVDNVQDGNDDCKEYFVSPGKITELRDLCKKVLDTAIVEPGQVVNGYKINSKGESEYMYEDGEIVTNPDEVAELLPTGGGFFFGSTDYDMYYIDDVSYTYNILNELIKEPGFEYADFVYHSSW